MNITIHKRATIAISALLGLTLLFCTLTAAAASIHWQNYSASVFAAAKKQHKAVLLYGYSPQCPYCNRMSSNTLSDPVIINLINRRFIPVKLDVTQESGVANQFDISGVPTVLLLNADKSVIKTIYGYLDANEFSSKLQ